MPQQRLTLSQRIFYLGLLVMLAAAILSTTISEYANPVIPASILSGAVAALAARIWQHRIHRAARKRENLIDFAAHSTS